MSHRRLTATVSGGTLIRLFHPQPLLTTRSLHSSAAGHPQFDHDKHFSSGYDVDDDESEENILVPATEREESRWRRGVQWVFIGNPSAKKHVFAGLLSKVVGVPHISIGSLVRQELSPRSDLYKQIANAINQGKLVPENIIFGLLSNRLEEGYDRGETGFILEGIPRTRLQAEILDQLADIELVVNFKCCEGRIPGDRTISDGCTPSHATKNPTTISSKLSQDGSEPKVLAFYAEQRKLLEDYYRSQKKLIDFQVGSAFRDTWKGLLAVLHLPHFDVNHVTRRLGTESSKP
ncbi:hypothetical protein Droror1_Dr00021425 [Drosera rotundifolia]